MNKLKISFPSFELNDIAKQLDKHGYVSTHRIRKEYDKYKLGKIYNHPKLGNLRVVSITKMIDISYSPAYKYKKHWTKQQLETLQNTNKIEYIVLERVK